MTQIFNSYIISIFLTLFTIVQVRGVSSRQIQESIDLVTNKDLNNPSAAIDKCSTENTTTTNTNHKYITGKKWQVGKVSRKHYEIINMLWRKTNIFNDEGDEAVTKAIVSGSTDQNINVKATKHTKSRSLITFPNIEEPSGRFFQASTPSYIEFYYLDEAVDQTKRYIDQNIHTGKTIPPTKTALNDLKIYSRLPLFVFHANEPMIAIIPTVAKTPTKNVVSKTRSYTTPKLSTKTSQSTKNQLQNMPFHFHQLSLQYPGSKTLESNRDTRIINNLFNESNYKTKKFATSAFKDVKHSSLIFQTPGDNNTNNPMSVSTKVYDRIKFFEIYDSNTLEPRQMYHRPIDYEEDENQPDTNELDRDHKILLAHIDKDLQHTEEIPKKKYEKKHVKSYEFENITTAQIDEFEANLSVVMLNSSPSFSTENIVQRQQFFNDSESIINSSKCALWSEYPFVAVYVYELYRIYCDAAIISPHWLMVSGSCLSQNSVEHNENSRSAFVTYCGNNWWDPERITYVKSCSIHPRFNPHDNSRYNYNIGLIQVISSMASACSNWSPVSLMSHQFGTDPDGSFALAVGWGLDRFITRPSTDLPRTPLSVFEGKVFSDACPGNSVYKNLHHSNSEITKNIYCLLLPPYTGEETDAVHGGLLVVGGKLIALYLQEERRHWGFQSAIYTGIWKLVPWIIRVAKEPEEADFLI